MGACNTVTLAASSRLPRAHLLAEGAYGRISHTRNVLSIALDSRWEPSGLSAMPVTLSVWPLCVDSSASLRRSHTLMLLSMLPVYTCAAQPRPDGSVREGTGARRLGALTLGTLAGCREARGLLRLLRLRLRIRRVGSLKGLGAWGHVSCPSPPLLCALEQHIHTYTHSHTQVPGVHCRWCVSVRASGG